MKVRVGQVLYYVANGLDRVDARTNLEEGTQVKVINVHGCPPANTMGHCYVGDTITGKFIGMVCTNSLHTKADYMDYLKNLIAQKEMKRQNPTLTDADAEWQVKHDAAVKDAQKEGQ
jgi:hypothetical protein